MPIRESQKALYPDNWPEVRERIRNRAGDKCEKCGVKNHAVGYRTGPDGRFVEEDGWSYLPDDCDKLISIVCTTAHLDHDPANCSDDNLRFWCQQCHNRYDAKHRAAGRKARALEASGQTLLSDSIRESE